MKFTFLEKKNARFFRFVFFPRNRHLTLFISSFWSVEFVSIRSSFSGSTFCISTSEQTNAFASLNRRLISVSLICFQFTNRSLWIRNEFTFSVSFFFIIRLHRMEERLINNLDKQDSFCHLVSSTRQHFHFHAYLISSTARISFFFSVKFVFHFFFSVVRQKRMESNETKTEK